MNTFRIIFFSILLAILYGILHDLITAHVCVEYFSLGHPKVIESMSPVLLALTWGVLATWWVGLFLGIIISIGANAGNRPKAAFQFVMKQIIYFLIILFILALIFGIIGYFLGKNGSVYLVGNIAEYLSPTKHAKYIFDIWMHLTSYIGGFLGGIILAIRIYRKRKLLKQNEY